MRRAEGRAVRGAPSALPCACAFVCFLLLSGTHATNLLAGEGLFVAGKYQGTSRHLTQGTDATTPDAGRVLDGQYVVVFSDTAGDAAAAANALVQQLLASMAAAPAAQQLQQQQNDQIVQAATAPGDQTIRVLRTLGSSRAPKFQAFLEVPDNETTGSSSSSSSIVSANSHSTSNPAAGLQAAVLQAPAAALQHIRQTGLVKAIFRDRVIVPQDPFGTTSSSSSSKCVDTAQIQAGVSRPANARLHWPECRPGTEKLVWTGSNCSRNPAVELSDSSPVLDAAAAEVGLGAAAAPNGGSVVYTAVKAVDAVTGQTLLSSNGTPCVAYAQGLSHGRTRQWFGGCGKAPRFAPSLPVVLCSTDSSSSSSNLLGSSAADAAVPNGKSPQDLQQQQQQGQQRQAAAADQQQNANGQQQQSADPADDQTYDHQYYDYSNDLQAPPQDDSNTRSAFDKPAHGAVVKDALGGVAKPFTTTDPLSPVQSPSPASRRRRRRRVIGPGLNDPNPNLNLDLGTGLLQNEALAAGEQVPSGVSFVEGASANAVPVTGGPSIDKTQQVTVAVCDSGVDSTHPDLAYAGGQTWVREPSQIKAGDMVDAGVDFYGHGTHVAGIIGARNNGAGVVGVAPSVPIYSLKVLDGSGQGALSDALDAVTWATSKEGQALNIKVINLSIATYVSPQADDYQDTLQVVCQIFQQASDAGILVVAAAGNYQESLLNYLPAACPAVAAVTSVDPSSGTPSAFSNFLPAEAPDAQKACVIAAPGSGVLSTMSIQKEASRYRELSGTSQAAPHVAGIAATCILSGACPTNSTGMQKLAVIQAAAQERLTQQQPYGFAGDPATPKGLASQKYYGFLAWSKFWQR